MSGENRELAADVSDGGPSSAAPSSRAPTSGVTRSLFAGDGGPGYWIHEGAVEVVFPDLGTGPFEVIRLSPTALWFDSGTEALAGARLPARKPTRVYLRCGGERIGPLRAQVVELDPKNLRADLPCTGLRLADVPLEAGRAMLAMLRRLGVEGRAEAASQLPTVEEEVDDPARILAIVRALSSVGNKGILRRPAVRGRVHLSGLDIATRRIEWTAEGEPVTWGPGPHVVDIIGYNSVYRLDLPDVTEAGGQTWSPLPTRIQRVRHRFFRRVVTDGALRVQFRHPLWRDLRQGVHAVHNISYGGLCFAMDPEEDLLFPGLLIPLLMLESEGETIFLRAQVRAITRDRPGEPAMCGVSVTPYAQDDEPKWLRLVSQALYPTTATSENHTEMLWSMFEESGYFKLAGKNTEAFMELKRSFVDLGQRAAQAPHLICQAVWPSERGVEASASFLKAYESAWMAHQLAKRPGKPPAGVQDAGQILRDLYLRGFEHPQMDPNYRWTISYVEPSVPWIAKTCLDFAAKYTDANDAMVMPVRMMKVECNELVHPDGSSLPYDIGPATADEKAMVLEVIQAARPWCYVDALDFVPERLDLGEVTEHWQAMGFERRREIYAARKNGVPVAALIMETGEVGTNLFRLLDATRLIPFSAQATAAYPALMDTARRWYAERGRASFLFFREDEDWSYAEPARIHDVSEPALWIIASRLVPDFLEHVCEVASPKAPRRRR
jgi:hypothetical protein